MNVLVIDEADIIADYVIVNVPSVGVRTYDELKPAAENFVREFHSDFVSLLRRSFARLE